MELGSVLKALLIGIIGIVVIALVYSELVPDIKSVGANVTASGSKLAGLYGSPLQIIIAGAVLIGIILMALKVARD